jgi:hypothetical protein
MSRVETEAGDGRASGPGAGRGRRIDVDRDEALAALEDRLARRRDYFAKGKERNFDEDDDFWGRGLSSWAEEQALPTLEDSRSLVGGLFVELVPKITTEDSKKIRELVRNSAIRDDRRLTPRELEVVATSAEQIKAAIAPLEKEAEKATGSKKGAVTKHIHRITDGLLTGAELNEEDTAIAAGVDQKNVEKARDLGNGLLKEVLETAEPDSTARAHERPLPEDGRPDPEGGSRRDRPVGAEGARDVSRHRVASRGRARGRVDAVNRLEETGACSASSSRS